MAKKGVAQKMRIVSPATNKNGNPTGTTYYVKKGKNAEGKLEMRKYDRYAYNPETGKVGMHVKFTEKKLPSPSKK